MGNGLGRRRRFAVRAGDLETARSTIFKTVLAQPKSVVTKLLGATLATDGLADVALEEGDLLQAEALMTEERVPT